MRISTFVVLAIAVGFTTAGYAQHNNQQRTNSGNGPSAAAQTYNQSNRAYDNAYNAANAANKIMKFEAGRIVPGGSQVYGAGNALGTYIMTHPVTVNRNPQPPKPYTYQPQPIPQQACQRLPSYPTCSHVTTH